MSVDIFGAVLASLDVTIRIVRSVHNAVIYAKELPTVLDSHRKELEAVKVIVSSANNEPELQSHIEIVTAVKSIGISTVEVQTHLDSLSGRRRDKEIGIQLLRGAKEKETLNTLMKHLSRRKDDMTTMIGILNVRLAKRLEEKLAEIADRAGASNGGRHKSRIVTNNRASGRGFMMNAPVLDVSSDRDLYEGVDEVLIDKNVAENEAIMLNYATTINILNRLADEFISKLRGEVKKDT